jgi:hypothetical protein
MVPGKFRVVAALVGLMWCDALASDHSPALISTDANGVVKVGIIPVF